MREHSKSVFNATESLMTSTRNVENFMTDSTERHKCCMNSCIKKQRQFNHGVSQVNKDVVIFGIIQHIYEHIMNSKCATLSITRGP